MDHFNTANALAFLVFTLFAHNLQLYAKDFRGASQAVGAVVSIAGLASMVAEYGFLLYYGYKVVWWAPIVLFAASLALMFVTGRLQNRVGAPTLGLLGLLVAPICGYLMFTSLPVH
ncbi:hypothetical protein [Hymenobacter daeguensis]